MIKLTAKELRVTMSQALQKKQLKKNPIYIIVDNVLDTYNIGSIFRLADAVAVTKVFLCAGSETPPNHRIKKASINTTEWVEWEYQETALAAIAKLRREVPDIQIVSVEQNDRSVPYDEVAYTFPVALVVGHETDGVSKQALDASDAIAESIPGSKRDNRSVACAFKFVE